MSLIVLYSILGGHLLISFIYALFIYLSSRKYYRPCIVMDKDNNPIDLHKKYDAFHPHDKLCFIQLWVGAFFCAPIKAISSFSLIFLLSLHIRLYMKIYKDYDTNPIHRKKLKGIISCYSYIVLLMNGAIRKRRYVEYEEVYKKYLGEDYNFEDDKYSVIISNHIGFFDIILITSLYAPGFVARKSIKDVVLIGTIARSLKCILIDREDPNSRKNVFDSILEWQNSFYNETTLAPLALFPEGGNSCGRNIMTFKKGAFFALLPVKPNIITIDQSSSFHLTVGGSNEILHFFKNFCHFINTIYYTVLPTIRPTDYMFENYKHLGNEKWEIYANVVRKIYSEVGGLEEVNQGFRDKTIYMKAMHGIYDPSYGSNNVEKKEENVNEQDNNEHDSNENKNDNNENERDNNENEDDSNNEALKVNLISK